MKTFEMLMARMVFRMLTSIERELMGVSSNLIFLIKNIGKELVILQYGNLNIFDLHSPVELFGLLSNLCVCSI